MGPWCSIAQSFGSLRMPDAWSVRTRFDSMTQPIADRERVRTIASRSSIPIRSMGTACPSSDFSAFADHGSVVATMMRRDHFCWTEVATKESISSFVRVAVGA